MKTCFITWVSRGGFREVLSAFKAVCLILCLYIWTPQNAAYLPFRLGVRAAHAYSNKHKAVTYSGDCK